MISVLLTLLKIIGIVLLSLLGLFLVLILLVLFVPVRYRLKGSYKEELVAYGKITWLLHFISISIEYNKEPITSVKLLGIPLDGFINKKDSSANPKADNIPTQGTVPDKTDDSTNNQQDSFNPDSHTKEMEPISDVSLGANTTDKSKSSDVNNKSNHTKEKQNFISNIRQKITDIIIKIKQIIQNIKSGKEKLDYYISILKKSETKQAFLLCKKRIFKLLKHILPKKMKVNLNMGFEDPSATGYLLAVYSVLPKSISQKINLQTNFNQQILEGDFNIKGHVNAWSLLYQGLCVLFDKNCKSLYQIVKKEILNERN